VGRNIIENRVRITNGTATVSEEIHVFGANRSLEQSEKAGCELMIRKPGELLRRFFEDSASTEGLEVSQENGRDSKSIVVFL